MMTHYKRGDHYALTASLQSQHRVHNTNDINIGSVAPTRLTAADCLHLARERPGRWPVNDS